MEISTYLYKEKQRTTNRNFTNEQKVKQMHTDISAQEITREKDNTLTQKGTYSNHKHPELRFTKQITIFRRLNPQKNLYSPSERLRKQPNKERERDTEI